MFNELLEKKRYSFHEGFDNWEDAVKAACQPLIEEGAILPSYVNSIIRCVNEYGPYIVIAPNICIPHAQEAIDGDVKTTSICFMKTEKPVHFSDDPEHDARLFFVLASENSELHLHNLTELVGLISDEEVVEKLLNAKSFEDLKKIQG
ncbi:PTS sugar transporter subunit IIA [Clostridium chauvoei]|uniref:PTS sugar transporter subunit IIA n=1 Tax=Clostridium chauvoei TaxID=46867 RepID=UPI001C863E18|nr:PTS sugar transporter subunit IIA [Clostridium chauvoei]MBX7294945.1 PTS sugar transporter subunit IIA [Clostridium chauvoei]MBX7305094.1 PTS sugar transporter subunit IIA [Clostridium chauvoei]MBX7312432.1 PTS sugar transporter subunit IIA [Clostridium chauvoei]MBX7350427.1 PTS sugar transporter subunit IIA [Clostridium chauvoei]